MIIKSSPALQYALDTIGRLNKQQIDTLNKSMSIGEAILSTGDKDGFLLLLNSEPKYLMRVENKKIKLTVMGQEV